MTAQPPSKLPPRPAVEPARWSLAWAGFYLSCAGVALGAGLAGGGYFFFESTGWLAFGATMSIVSCVTCYVTLRKARQETPPRS